MWNTNEIWDYIETEFQRFRPALYREFSAAAAILKPILGYDEYLAWAREGVTIARGSYRASEAASEYFKASPSMVRRLRFVQFNYWSRLGRSLLQLSPAVAAAYYRASPVVLGPIVVEEFEFWTAAGRRLWQDSWRAQALAAQFFDTSPLLFRLLSIEEVTALAALLEQLSRHSPDRAAQYLDQAVPMLAKIEKRDRLPMLQLGAIFATGNAKGAHSYLEAAPEVLQRLSPKQRPVFLSLVGACAHDSWERALALFTEGSKALAQIDPAAVSQILTWADEVATLLPAAGVEFLRLSPELLPKLGLGQLERWLRHGTTLLIGNQEAGLAYFRLQSKRAQDTLRALSHVCELEGIRQVLRLYCKGLTGRQVRVLATTELVGKAIGWTAVEQATSDGSAIFLPPAVEDFPSRAENFAFFKVLATHQAGHLEFGSYDFAFDRPATLFDDGRAALAAAQPAATPAISAFERFFDLFPDRKLAKHLFTILEDGRVDTLVLDEYGGIRRFYREVQRRALRRRPSLVAMPLREACVELLLRLSLSEAGAKLPAPPGLGGVVRRAAGVARRLWSAAATVEDAAEATLRLYDLLHTIPNVRLRLAGDWEEIDLDDTFLEQDLAAELAALGAQLSAGSEEMPFADPEDVDFRGDLKPELVQTLMKVREERPDGQNTGTPISPEALKRLLEKNANIEINGLSEGDVDPSMGLFVSNLLREKGKSIPRRQQKERQRSQQPEVLPGQLGGNLEAIEVASFRYDEWDFRAGDYRPGWCRLSEQQLKEGELLFYHETMRNHAALVRTVRKQFELLRPELFKKIKRLPDGEEFDLDALIEAVVDKRTGHTPSEKIYWRRNKVQRDVAVAFLLDMSASTDEEIEEIKHPDPWDDEAPRVRGRRIIDVEKESLVLLTQALQAIGDRYGIYGFSGYGHESCEFYVVKDLGEEFGDRVKRRIDKIAPMRGTRMGVAIRHATAKLAAEDARLRILVLLSDGYPQDHDYYGAHHAEKEYALHDTRMALLEAKRKNILPFCLTVDKAGHDYLKTMCADIGYEIVNDVQSLPRRLPALYHMLTT